MVGGGEWLGLGSILRVGDSIVGFFLSVWVTRGDGWLGLGPDPRFGARIAVGRDMGYKLGMHAKSNFSIIAKFISFSMNKPHMVPHPHLIFRPPGTKVFSNRIHFFSHFLLSPSVQKNFPSIPAILSDCKP